MCVSNVSFPTVVAEIQGLYGAFSFPEKLLQKIWLRGDFDRQSARLLDGRKMRLVHPGKWNLLGGPDFTGARLRLGDAEREITGDVEVHLRASDWDAHGHARDPAYDRVILHVVLFPPEQGRPTCGATGAEIPVLALLPLLHRGLEEFAADEAVETLANRPLARVPNELVTLPQTELAGVLQRYASARWRQKVHFARVRVERLGWEAACHHAALEILGYRFNRAPMLRIAGAWPLSQWANGGLVPAELVAAEADGWSLQGVRPANHPLTRLRQYGAWTIARPEWPNNLLAFASRLPEFEAATPTRDVRRGHRLVALREEIGCEVIGGALGGSRLDNVICDGLLPLVAAKCNRSCEAMWFHWFPGDLPAWLKSGLRQLGYFDGRSLPACHGVVQGLLGWFLEREPKR